MTMVLTTRKISETKSDEVCAKAGIWRMNKAATVYVGLWRTGAKQKLLRFGGNLGRQPGQPRRQVGIISMAFWLAIFRGEKMKYGCIDRTLESLSITRNKSIRGSGECRKSRKRCSQFHVVGKLPTPRPFTQRAVSRSAYRDLSHTLASLQIHKHIRQFALQLRPRWKDEFSFDTESVPTRTGSTIVYNKADCPKWPRISHVQWHAYVGM
jgi:hypothetical protein